MTEPNGKRPEKSPMENQPNPTEPDLENAMTQTTSPQPTTSPSSSTANLNHAEKAEIQALQASIDRERAAQGIIPPPPMVPPTFEAILDRIANPSPEQAALNQARLERTEAAEREKENSKRVAMFESLVAAAG